MAEEKTKSLIPIERIARQIYLIRGQKVMLDADLAALYAVQTKVFNQAMLSSILRSKRAVQVNVAIHANVREAPRDACHQRGVGA